MPTHRLFLRLFSFLLAILIFSTVNVYAGDSRDLSTGQTIYVPAYSHIYAGNKETPFLLTVTLSIRNIDPRQKITITRTDYYETQGHLLTRYIKTPRDISALGTIRFVIPEHDEAGGSGANFIVKWESEQPVNPPIVESIMIGTRSQQGISFTSRGQVISIPK